jgi:uncharacterized protein YidB (DUF937 family)
LEALPANAKVRLFIELPSGRNEKEDPNKYPLIFEADREVIKDPNLIFPGRKIRIAAASRPSPCNLSEEPTMGLMDILNGMQNGPRGGSQVRAQGSDAGGGMSPITMALLGLLAYKTIKGFSGSSAQPPSADAGVHSAGLGLDEILRSGPGGSMDGSQAGGGGGLGGLLAGLAGGAGLGGLLSGGLGDMLEQFQSAGKGDAVNSWIGPGQNQPIAPHELSQVLSPEQIEFLTQRSGLPREELLAGLSEQLPQLVDRLTPGGCLPTADEMSRTV